MNEKDLDNLKETSQTNGKSLYEEVMNMPKEQQKKFAEEMFSIVHGIADKTESQII